MCKYGIKTENARFGMCAAIAKRFSGDAAPERLRFFRIQSVSVTRRVLVSAPARGSARVTGRRQPSRQLCRRLVSKTSTRLALTPVYLPHIDRINVDVKLFRNAAFHYLDMILLKQGRIIVKNNKIL